jgi:hypothetical protein
VPDGAVVSGRERGCTTFKTVFGSVSCWEIRRQGAPQDEGHGKEERQADFAIGLKLAPQLAQV